jgi:hypothetical protein
MLPQVVWFCWLLLAVMIRVNTNLVIATDKMARPSGRAV